MICAVNKVMAGYENGFSALGRMGQADKQLRASPRRMLGAITVKGALGEGTAFTLCSRLKNGNKKNAGFLPAFLVG